MTPLAVVVITARSLLTNTTMIDHANAAMAAFHTMMTGCIEACMSACSIHLPSLLHQPGRFAQVLNDHHDSSLDAAPRIFFHSCVSTDCPAHPTLAAVGAKITFALILLLVECFTVAFFHEIWSDQQRLN
jgi:hypothetical protein